jgi:hypothetical protein
VSLVRRAIRPDAPEVTYINPRFRAHADADTCQTIIEGACQAPVFLTGDHSFYAPAVAPTLGDYAVVDVLVANINRTGEPVGNERKVMIKRLRAKADRSLWWHEASGAFPVSEHHKVLGTILLSVRYSSDVRRLPWVAAYWSFVELRELFKTRRTVAATRQTA